MKDESRQDRGAWGVEHGRQAPSSPRPTPFILHRSSFILAAVPHLLLGLLLIASLYLIGCTYARSDGAYNADHLYCSDFCRDVWQGRSLAGWHLPGAPYLFPDMLWVLSCQLLPGGVAGEFMGYCFAFFLSLLAAVVWLGHEIRLETRRAFLTAAVGCLLLVAVHLGPAYHARATHLASPGSHAGVIPVGLALLALAVRLLRRGFRPLPALTFLLLGSLAAVSDKLLLAQFLAPLAVALLLLTCCLQVRLRQLVGLLGLIGSVVLLSAGLRTLLLRLGFHLLHIEYAFGTPHGSDLGILLGQVARDVGEQPLLQVLMPLYLLAGVLAVLLCLREGWRVDGGGWRVQKSRSALHPPPSPLHPPPSHHCLAALTLLLVPLGNLGALWVAGMAGNSAVYRYTLPCYLLPPLLTGWLLALLPGRAALSGRLAFPLLAVLLAGWRLADRGPEWAGVPLEPPYPPLAQTLDRLAEERGPLRGLAEFWTARRLRFLTRGQVVLCPLDRFGQPFFHASNPSRFLADDQRDTAVPAYNFIILKRGGHFEDPGPELIQFLYGPPRERVTVGEDDIWLYDHLCSTPLQRFLLARDAERLRASSPGTGPASPVCLAHPRGNMTPLATEGNLQVEPGESLEVRFAPTVRGKSLDVGAGHDDWLELELYAGEERLGTVEVPQVPFHGAHYEYPGIQARLLALPPALQGRAFDRVVVRPRANVTAAVTLAHLLVRPDDVPDTGINLSQRVPRVRLEAEWLPTYADLGDNSMASSTTDAQASAGRVRQVSATFAGVVNFTHYLSLPAGRYRLDFAVRVGDNSSSDEVAQIDAVCFAPGALLAARSLRGVDFPAAGQFTTHSLTLDLPDEANFLVFRFLSSGKTSVALDYLDIIALPEEPSPARKDEG
jgi:hypothetical protein